MVIRTRFSPSPTGKMHLGNARAALFSALFAAKHQGTFILRTKEDWCNEEILQDAKRLIRFALAPLLGARLIHSRRLFLTVSDFKEETKHEE